MLVMGVNGKVGQAATQIASSHGARVIGVARKNEPYEGHASSTVEVIDASATDVAARVRELTGGKGADIVFNTVGDPYFQAAHQSLALRGRQILIATIERIVPFNILEFYRGQHTYVGIDTLGLSSIATGAVLRELGPGFASGHLKPFPIRAERDLSAARRQSCFSRRRRFVARSGDPAAGVEQVVIASEAKQSILSLCGWMDCFASLAMTEHACVARLACGSQRRSKVLIVNRPRASGCESPTLACDAPGICRRSPSVSRAARRRARLPC